MFRIVIIALVLVGCTGTSKLDPAPRNLVCERVKLIAADATCVPEMSDAGDTHAHTARVQTKDAKVPIVCGLDASHLAMVCSAMDAKPEQKPAPPEPGK